MNKKCLILGAGFSKAIAGLPIMKEMFSSFEKIIEEQKLLQNKNRVNWGERIFAFLEKIENEFLRIPYSRAQKGGHIIESNYLDNFEALCSFVDLNLSFEIDARCESNGIEASLSGKPMFVNYTTSQLKEIRGYIANYLYLTLIKDNSDENLLSLFYNKMLQHNPSIITFNYDLVLDKYLFKKNKWLPVDGYGFIISNIPQLNLSFKDKRSDMQILKMHGSLNWKVDSIFYNTLELDWYNDVSEYFFPHYLKNEKKRGFRYEGGFSTKGWLLPSWIKQFTYPEIVKVWKQAGLKLKEASEIIFIGYSLPRADSAVYSLFSSVDLSDKSILIIDPNAVVLRENYSILFPKEKIKIIPKNLEDYLSN